jgi:hypothetical protein
MFYKAKKVRVSALRTDRLLDDKLKSISNINDYWGVE